MKKRLLAALLACILCFALLPQVALAAPLQPHRFVVGNIELFSNGNQTDVSDRYWTTDAASGVLTGCAATDDWNVYYEDDTATLYLRGATIQGDEDTPEGAGIYAYFENGGSLTIDFTGKNTVKGRDPSNWEGNTSGISVLGYDGYGNNKPATLIMRGDGTLDVEVGRYAGDDWMGTSYGIVVLIGSLVMESGTVTATAASGPWGSTGVAVGGALTMHGGKLHAKAGKAEGESSYSTGLSANSLTMYGGTLIAEAGEAEGEFIAYSRGISAGSATLRGGTVEATAKAASVSGADGDTGSSGIALLDGASIAGNAMVTAKAGAAKESYGIGRLGYFSGDIDDTVTMTGGTLVAEGQTSGLHVAPILSGYPSYRWRTSESGGFTANPPTVYPWSEEHKYVEITPEDVRPTPQRMVPTYTVEVTCLGPGASNIKTPREVDAGSILRVKLFPEEGAALLALTVNGQTYDPSLLKAEGEALIYGINRIDEDYEFVAEFGEPVLAGVPEVEVTDPPKTGEAAASGGFFMLLALAVGIALWRARRSRASSQ